MRYEEVEEQKKPSPSLGSAIPGQSLTGEPKGYAWERPPEFDKPEDALKYYIPKLTKPDVMDDILLALENGFPLTTLVKGIYMNGVMDGLHSIDVGLIIAPVLHELILSTANSYEISFKEIPTSVAEQKAKKEQDMLENSVLRFLEQVEDKDEGTEVVVKASEAVQKAPPQPERVEEPAEKPVEETEELQPEAPEPQGLMSRREKNVV